MLKKRNSVIIYGKSFTFKTTILRDSLNVIYKEYKLKHLILEPVKVLEDILSDYKNMKEEKK
jgi:hypothetical protein